MYGCKIQAAYKDITGEYGSDNAIYRLTSPKLKSAKNNKPKKIAAKWAKTAKITGYEI